ncbi:MAG: hypothetical protein SCK70_16100, partial [bacterium]|nr:hypothetical protein [bacterium]
DDGNTGTASAYDVRYSTNPIGDNTAFKNATQASGAPAPSVAGTPETFVVGGLTPNTAYHFALKVIDDASNVSGLSNTASATTLASTFEYSTDNFNRTELGAGWAAGPEYQIVNNELANTTDDYNWGYLAVYKQVTNPIEVSFRWGQGADEAGIDEGGIAILLDDASTTANGYFVSLLPSTRKVNLYTLQNGNPGHRIGSLMDMITGTPTPQAGSVFKVEVSTDGSGHHFQCYVNDQHVGTISDPAKEFGNSAPHYAGVYLKGDLNNNVDDFTVGHLGEVDDIPPAAVTDLSAGSPSANSITLSWTAVGDDGNTGTASAYDVRYSTNPITDNTAFNNATQASGAPAPSVAGTPETFVVGGLSQSTTYHFALKVIDDASNVSDLSNSASATTMSSTINYSTDYFNRATLGSSWVAAPPYQIVNNELANTTNDNNWGYLAIYKPVSNPAEVAFRYGISADAA